AGDAAGALTEDGPADVTGGQLAASDPDTGAVLSWSGGAATALGAFAITPDGAWSYTLDPDAAQSLAAGQEVTETTEVTVSDGLGGTATQTLSVTITGTNDAPSLDLPTITATAGTINFGTLTATDPEGSAVTFALDTPSTNADVVVSSNGDYLYLPGAGFVGTDSFKVTVSDPDGGSRVETVTVQVATSLVISNAPAPAALNLAAVDQVPAQQQDPDLPDLLQDPDGTDDAIDALLDAAFPDDPDADQTSSDAGDTGADAPDADAGGADLSDVLGGLGDFADLVSVQDDVVATTTPSA
ncbi:Ig-like domain-containing protein, partial [Dinoroseobacter sp. S375]|uniref:Ig-like domain-containing protein n=1 Tax=Dinoroseobacter sp. S375 TaxID=3415136 RepID=UPI003C7CC034